MHNSVNEPFSYQNLFKKYLEETVSLMLAQINILPLR
jgi:hypothetical protein